MNQIACVESEFIVPVLFMLKESSDILFAYSNERGDVCVLVCEAPVMIQGMYSVLDAVSKWVLRNTSEVLVLDGIAVEGLPSCTTIVAITQMGNNFGYPHGLHFSAWYYFYHVIY